MQKDFLKLFVLAIGCLSLISCDDPEFKEKYKRIRNKRNFECPGDGKWPDDTDCGKFHVCQGSSESTTGWCGPGMSFDVDNQRCEMALAINCKDGDRPDWKPPSNWKGKVKETTVVTKKAATTKTEAPVVITTTKLADSLKENEPCAFSGLQPDKENCQSYFYCKDADTKKQLCPDKQLFDDETKSCKEFKDVYCGERPVNDKGKDPCRSKPNGVYPNIETGCSEFYQCNGQRKVKSGECPQGLKFNLLSLRCDWPSNVPVPCGTRMNNSGSTVKLNLANLNILLLISINSIFLIFF